MERIRTRAILLLSLVLMVKGLVLLSLFGASVAIYVVHYSAALPREVEVELPPLSLRDLSEATTYLISGLFVLIGSIGILRLRGWGWLMAMIGQGLDLALGLLAYVNGHPVYWQMALDVLLVFYLNQNDVYRVFAAAKRRDGALQVGQEESVAPIDLEKEAALSVRR